VRVESKTIGIAAVTPNRYTTSRTAISWQKSDLFLGIASCHETESSTAGAIAPTNLLPPEYRQYIILIFYCGLVVHITDTRAQKWLAIHQCTLQKRCLHMTNTGRSKAVYPHHSCIVIRKSTENG